MKKPESAEDSGFKTGQRKFVGSATFPPSYVMTGAGRAVSATLYGSLFGFTNLARSNTVLIFVTGSFRLTRVFVFQNGFYFMIHSCGPNSIRNFFLSIMRGAAASFPAAIVIGK